MSDNQTDRNIEALGSRIHKARIDAGLAPQEAPARPGSAGKGMQAGYELAVAVLVFTLLGIGLDKWIGSTPLFLLAGLIFGFAAGMWNLYRSSLEPDATNDK